MSYRIMAVVNIDQKSKHSPMKMYYMLTNDIFVYNRGYQSQYGLSQADHQSTSKLFAKFGSCMAQW